MSVNSRSEIIKQMTGKSVTYGWGAITVFNRTRINRFLEQQYITRLQGYSFLPAFKGDVTLEGSASGTVQLESIVLGKPLLSFADEASLDDSYATVSMNVISGTVLMMQPGERVSRVHTSLRIRESQGYQVKLRIKLSVVAGSINDQGLVIMDLKEGVDFTCNVLPDYLDQVAIGGAFKKYFNNLPVYQRVFVLGKLDVSQYDPLAPKEFAILTQRAPEAENLASNNYGDGGVVVFIRVAGDEKKGTLPGEGSGFPYLIPDDVEGGENIYSAAIVVAEKWKKYAGGEQVSKLTRLLFPAEEIFESKDDATPYDYINFGNVDPASTQLTIEPTLVTLQAGESKTFKVLDAKGLPVSGVVWTAKSLNSRVQAGHGVISASGVYTAATDESIGFDSIRVIITGKVVQGDKTFTVSAGVTVSADGMVIAPQLSSRIIELKPKPVKLSVTATESSVLTWSMSTPGIGTLESSGNTAIYTPPTQEQVEFQTVQKIRVHDASTGQYTETTVLLFNDYLTDKVQPAHARHIKSKKTQTFEISDDAPVGVKVWSIVSGSGQFKDPSVGVFTAPDVVSEAVTVVKCDWTSEGFTRTFYSTIEMDHFEDEPSWSALNTFTVKVRDASGNLMPTGFAYRNGFQQIKLAVTIETKVVDSKPVRPSAEELQTLRLLHSNDSIVEPLLPEQSSISPDALFTWATHTLPNSIYLYPTTNVAASESFLPRLLDAESTVELEFYVHTTAASNRNDTFSLSFVGGSLESTFYSKVVAKDDGVVNLTPFDIPKIQDHEYTFKKQMISDGTLVALANSHSGKNGIVKLANDEGEPGTDYDYKLVTLDYYTLAFTVRKIADLRFYSPDVNTEAKVAYKSTVRWESRLKEETMFSFTGYAFKPFVLEGILSGEKESHNLQFDPSLNELVTKEGALVVPVNKVLAPGSIIFSMHRTDDVRYGDAVSSDQIKARDALYTSVYAEIMDEYGSWRKIAVGFPPAGVYDRENLLIEFIVG